jgi:hypothetical protein
MLARTPEWITFCAETRSVFASTLLSLKAARLCLAPFGNWPTGDISVLRKCMKLNVETPAVQKARPSRRPVGGD